MRLTIVFDNTACHKSLTAGWGFSCLVEAAGKTILFDTGSKAAILADNMKKLRVDPFQIDAVFISHDHWDHTGGLSALPGIEKLPVYVPASYSSSAETPGMISISEPVEIFKNIFSTGELKHTEQSMVIRLKSEAVVIAGCSHPGVGEIMNAASVFGKVTTIIGGLHGFAEFDKIEHLKRICPTHCTRYIERIAGEYPQKYIPGGAGRIITL